MGLVQYFLLVFLIDFTSSSKILGVFPHFGKSHFLAFQPLMEQLALRGHQVTVLSYFPRKTPLKNYKDIAIRDPELTTEFLGFNLFENQTENAFSKLMQLKHLREISYEKILNMKEIQQLSKSKFDLVVIEMFNTDVFFGLVYKIKAPSIAITSHDLFTWHNEYVANYNPPSVAPTIFSQYSDKMKFTERFYNTIVSYLSFAVHELSFQPQDVRMAEKTFGEEIDLDEVARNTSLVLVNTHFTIFRSRSFVPSVIEVGGLHVKKPQPLSQDLQKLMDQSEGVIYFSMGSVLKGDSLHDKKQQAFIKVFSELKQTVLWKRESPLSVNVKNIVTNGWYPQRDILAHPKVQLFITHCGLLGTNEAVSSGVPMVGIPMFGDQHHNAKALESIGVAVTLDFNELNENNIREAINKVLQNPSYKENAIKTKEAYLDRPMSPLDTAVYWVEYVIRHKGAPHLKSAARHLTWYQYHNLDVYALLLLILYISYLAVKFIIKFVCALCCKNPKVKTQ